MDGLTRSSLDGVLFMLIVAKGFMGASGQNKIGYIGDVFVWIYECDVRAEIAAMYGCLH